MYIITNLMISRTVKSLVRFFTIGHPNMKLSPIKYDKGQSKSDALNIISQGEREKYNDYIPPNTPDLSLFTDDKEIGPFLRFPRVLLWAACTINQGRTLDSGIDHLLSNVTIAGSAFYKSKKPLKNILDELLNSRESLRNYEEDVEEFLISLELLIMPRVCSQP